MIDFFFHYKYVCRNLLLNRYFDLKFNTNQIWKINYLIIYFSVNELENLEDISVMNYAYLVRFFFGRKVFLSNYKCKFHRGIFYYSFIIQSLIKKMDLYYILFFYVIDIKVHLSFEYIDIKVTKEYFELKIKDMYIFLEKKNNLGLFNLDEFLSIRISYPDYWYIKDSPVDIFKIYKN